MFELLTVGFGWSGFYEMPDAPSDCDTRASEAPIATLCRAQDSSYIFTLRGLLAKKYPHTALPECRC
ncbi:hypothetical protein LMG31884_11590 [Xanthomonas hydrangeae]|nr:hypothetical protein LMG31884_11590 [Xanthomonas hydrangeae]CAD7714509.1 hypothetical protein LMG31884_11590 [Xanthomonas hydrangeae]CAD7724055.1 hypothetical protein LMG31887_11590 [Xanthomonas hydrangeae]CAD7724059.1 hypothetical protein LMG31887_11590 [Xanthomonas hydrangeae]